MQFVNGAIVSGTKSVKGHQVGDSMSEPKARERIVVPQKARYETRA